MINSFIFSLNFRATRIPRVGVARGVDQAQKSRIWGRLPQLDPQRRTRKCQGNNTPPACGPSMTHGGWTNNKHLLDIIIPLLCAHYFQM